MKLYCQFLLLLLPAVVALAHPPPLSNLALFSNSTNNATYPTIGQDDVVYRYADLMSGPEPENDYANPTAPTTGWNGDASKGSYTPVIRMSTIKEHVGEFQGQRLFNVIHNALLKICPYERGRIGCYEDMPGAGEPNDDNSLPSEYKYYNKFWVLDVPYKTNNGDYATNAWFTITARAIFRNQKYPGLGAATYKMAAGVYARATEASLGGAVNCYVENFNKNSRPYQFCNVPRHVLIALPAEDGKVIESWLSMTIAFNGDTEYGQLDCYGTMSSVIDLWDKSVLPDVAKSMKIPEDEWKIPCTQCWNERECFEVREWRKCTKCDYIS